MKAASLRSFVAALALGCSTLHAARVIDLGIGEGVSINDSGKVLIRDAEATYIWDRGVRSPLRISYGLGLNNAGQVTGAIFQRFAYFPATVEVSSNSSRFIKILGWLGGDDGAMAGQGLAINNHNQVTGGAYVPGAQHAFLYDQTGMHDIGMLGERSFGHDINDFGTVVGVSFNLLSRRNFPFIYENGIARHLFDDDGLAYGINNLGTVVGQINHEIMIYDHGRVTTLGPGTAFDVNDSRQVVGEAYSRPCRDCANEMSAFRYQDGVFTNLRSIDPEWILMRADAINAQGEIVGVGSHNGHLAAFLLVP